MADAASSSPSTTTPARAFRALKSSTGVVVPLSAVVTAAMAVALYLRDGAIERLHRVEAIAEQSERVIQEHEGRLIRTETKAQGAEESMHRVEAALGEVNAKLDRIAERSR